MSLKPLKSTTTKWSTRRFDIFSNCAIVHASPPSAKASFHWAGDSPGIVVAVLSSRTRAEAPSGRAGC